MDKPQRVEPSEEKEISTCQECGRGFVPTAHGQMFCNAVCHNSYWGARREIFPLTIPSEMEDV
jgi:hypothetical protein